MNANNQKYFLFTQKYCALVDKLFSKNGGMLLDDVLALSKSKNVAVQKAYERIYRAIVEVEKESNIIILLKTSKKFFKKPSVQYARMEERLRGMYDEEDEIA